MSLTNSQKLAAQFEEWNIENTIAQLPQDKYDKFQKMAGEMLRLLGEY